MAEGGREGGREVRRGEGGRGKEGGREGGSQPCSEGERGGGEEEKINSKRILKLYIIIA